MSLLYTIFWKACLSFTLYCWGDVKMLDLIKGITVTFNSVQGACSITFSDREPNLALKRIACVGVWKKFLESKKSGVPTFPILSKAGNTHVGVPVNRLIVSGQYLIFMNEVIDDLMERLSDKADDEKITIEELEYAEKSIIRFNNKYVLEQDSEKLWNGTGKADKLMNRKRTVDKIRTDNDLVSLLNKSEMEGLFLKK